MQLLVKLIMNSLYGEQIRKDNEESYEWKSEHWIMTEYDERVSDYQNFYFGKYFVKLKDDAALEDETKKINTMPQQLCAFVVSISKQNMMNFIHAIDGFNTKDLYYEDTDSMYIENKHWDKLFKAGFSGENRLQAKNDQKDGGVLYGLFLARKIKLCLTINKLGFKEEHKTFKGFTKATEILDRKDCFILAEGKKQKRKFR